MYPSESVKYFDSVLCISAYLQKEPWHTSMVMSAEELSFLCYEKGWTKARNGSGLQLGSFGGGRLTGQLSPGCLADTGQTSLINEGPCPVHWGNLSTSWTYGKGIYLKFSLIRACFNKEFKGVKGSRSLYSKQHILLSTNTGYGLKYLLKCSLHYIPQLNFAISP